MLRPADILWQCNHDDRLCQCFDCLRCCIARSLPKSEWLDDDRDMFSYSHWDWNCFHHRNDANGRDSNLGYPDQHRSYCVAFSRELGGFPIRVERFADDKHFGTLDVIQTHKDRSGAV